MLFSKLSSNSWTSTLFLFPHLNSNQATNKLSIEIIWSKEILWIPPVSPPPTGFLHVPVVEHIYSLYVIFHKCLLSYPKYEYYSLGKMIQDNLLETLEITLYCASTKSQIKKEKLQIASTKIDLIKLLTRLSFDIKAINYNQYTELQNKLQEIGRMLGGWIKSS